ncbi:MAG TPA: imidazole glycerol phosphate synthase subunit HisH [Rhodocyclaceae bacterium]
MARIVVVDSGMGNLRSVSQAIAHVAGADAVTISDSPEAVRRAERVVFPGQGAMPDCTRELEARGLHQAVVEAAGEKPFLGICIGEQMLFDWSDEGGVPGLGVFAGRVERFPEAAMHDASGARLKVPHMGWNGVRQRQRHALWRSIDDGSRFYFVHSYFVVPADQSIIAGESTHGVAFTAAVARDNIFAVQFHPEKSATAGLQMLTNFVGWKP